MTREIEKIGIDIVGFGPVGRNLAKRVTVQGSRYSVASISDSSITIYPKDTREVLEAINWKESQRGKLSGLSHVKCGPAGEPGHGVEHSSASVAIDVTNSDYGKAEEAKKRAESILSAGKHFVSASKVALANYFPQILERARKKRLSIGYGATICGARHAIRVAQSLEDGEVQSASAVLNASTTLILSRLEESRAISFKEACKEASDAGILESDWAIDLDGIDAAAKTSILANVLFPSMHLSINEVEQRGIRDKEAMELIKSARGDVCKGRVRLVSQIEDGKASVRPRLLPFGSPLIVQGRFSIVSLSTANLGEISITSLGGGVSLTASILLSDIDEATRQDS